ncbi:MAG: polyprenol monophosphomannose synthase [Acidobacteria bacterium]|nr:polyprenol monophosphomannose synthase [Acidobacteriota bacterium]
MAVVIVSRPRTALVIVPTYNERDNLPVLAAALMQQPNVSLLVVDDRSPDGTGAVADALARQYPQRIEVLHRTERPGLGRSYLDAMRRSINRPFDAICQMDCDLSHDPRHLPDLLAGLEHADLVIGSRYVAGGGIVNWPLRRRLLSRYANVYIRLVTRIGPRDCTSGYRAWRREALASLPFERFGAEGYSFLVEMLYVACRMGRRVSEVPITFIERRQGESKLSAAVLFESILTPWRLIARPFRAMV